jgi:hypothetical protein
MEIYLLNSNMYHSKYISQLNRSICEVVKEFSKFLFKEISYLSGVAVVTSVYLCVYFIYARNAKIFWKIL